MELYKVIEGGNKEMALELWIEKASKERLCRI